MTCNIESIYKDAVEALAKHNLSKIDTYKNVYKMGFNAKQLDNTVGKDSKEVLAYLNIINTDKPLGGVVGVYYNKENTKGTPDHLAKVITVDYDKAGKKLKVQLDDNTEWTFLEGNSRSKSSGKGVHIEIKELGGIDQRIKSRQVEIDSVLEESELRSKGLGSKGNPQTIKYGAYDKLEKDMWKDPSKMKDLLEVLVSNDGVDDEHTTYLRKLLGMIVDNNKPILNEFRTYINNNAKENSGVAVIDKKNSKLLLNTSKADKDNLAQEVYLHEMIHLSVEFALRYNKAQLGGVTNKLAELYSQAQDHITIEKLITTVGNVEEAKALYDQMFKGKNSLSEFIALGMTNKHIKGLLKEIKTKSVKLAKDASLFDKMFMLVRKLFSTIKEIYTGKSDSIKGDKALQHYVSELWEHNAKTVKKEGLYNKVKNSIVDARDALDKTIIRTITKSTGPVVEAVDNFLEEHQNNVIVRGAGVVWYLGRLINPFQSERFNVAVKRVMSEYSVMLDRAFGDFGLGWLTAPENSVMQLINYIKKDDALTVKLEKLALAVQKIDMFRQETIKRVGKKVKNSFSKNIGRKTQIALTRVLVENDVQSLLTTYSINDIKEMLKDSTKLTDAIQKEYNIIDKQVQSTSVRNYVKSQAKGLGYKLATGISGSSVQHNAYDIVTLKNTSMRLEGVDKIGFKVLLHSVDRLATLEGLLKTSQELKDKVAVLDNEGLEATLAIHSVYVANAIKYSKSYSVYNYPDKGEIKDTKDEQIDIRIGVNTPEMIEIMKVNGYEKTNYKTPKGLSVFINKNYSSNEFTKQAMAKINEGKKLHLINYTDEDARDLESHIIAKTASKDIQEQMKAITLPVMDGFKAVREVDGSMVYGYTMDKFEYADMTLQDNKAPLLLGKMIAEVEEKVQSHKINNKVYTLVLKDMDENYKRGDSLYVEVGPDAKNKGKTATKYSEELWKNMPSGLRKKVYDRKKGQRYIALRRDVADMYVGRRMPSLFGVRVPIVGKTVETVMSANDKLRVTKNLIKGATRLWEELVSMQKVDIVIRTPKVFISNVISNFNWAVALGQNPLSLVKDYLSLPKEINDYIHKRKEADSLLLDAQVETDITKKRALRLKANNIMKVISKNAIHDVYEAGLFTSIQQDVDDSDLAAKKRIEKSIEKNKYFKAVNDSIPQIVKDGVNTLYVTEGTGVFNVLEKGMMYSDFVARVSLYKMLINAGVVQNVALKGVAEAFVNYNRLLPRWMAWGEKLGLEWFMRYTLGANKNLVTALRDKPTNVLLLSTLLDSPNPSDASIFEKDFGYAFKSPWDVAFTGTEQNVLPPSSLELMGLI